MAKVFNYNDSNIKDLGAEESYWESGYNYTISRILSLIGVSNSWIYHKSLKDVKYGVYSPKLRL